MLIKALLALYILILPMNTMAADTLQQIKLQITNENGSNEFTVEVADDDASRARGLMGRKAMPEKSGMLFIFDEPYKASMWMKDTLIPLDIIFINDRGIIVKIGHGEPGSLKTISPGIVTSAVLELNAGICRKFGIKEGDKVNF